MNNDLPSVGTEDAPSMANYTFTIVADSGYESTTEGRCSAKQYGAVIYALHNDASYVEQRDSLAAERDELASRVRELERAALAAQPGAVGWTHWEARIKQLMEDIGQPHSRSVYQAFSQLVNEVTKLTAAPTPTEAKPAQDAVDAELLDWLESQINEHGAIHLHDGNNPNGHGLGLRPGSLNRTLRDAIRAAISAKKGGA